MLTRLVLMDNVPGRLELFIAPFSTLLQNLLATDFSSANTTVGLRPCTDA